MLACGPTTTGDTWRAAASGARTASPWIAGLAPYGFVIGVTIAASHVPALAGWASGPLIFAGSAQLVVIDLLDHGVAPAVVVVTALAVNLRLLFYSATIAPHWRGLGWWWRLLAPLSLVDPTFALGMDGYHAYDDNPTAGHAYYLGAVAVIAATWFTATAAGIAVGGGIPQSLGLGAVVPIFLVGEIVPRATDRPTVVSVAVAAVVVLAGARIPGHLATGVAMAAGISAGILTERAARRSAARAAGREERAT
jgi:predicted branched-subunit amino acid permease